MENHRKPIVTIFRLKTFPVLDSVFISWALSLPPSEEGKDILLVLQRSCDGSWTHHILTLWGTSTRPHENCTNSDAVHWLSASCTKLCIANRMGRSSPKHGRGHGSRGWVPPTTTSTQNYPTMSSESTITSLPQIRPVGPPESVNHVCHDLVPRPQLASSDGLWAGETLFGRA